MVAIIGSHFLSLTLRQCMVESAETTSAKQQDYVNFDLQIGRGDGQKYPVRVISSPAGEASATMQFPFAPAEVDRRLVAIHNALLQSAGRVRKRPTTEGERQVEEFGYGLFAALFSGKVLSCYEQSHNNALQQGKELRLRLRIEPPELACLPWEFMFDGSEYLCLWRNTSVVRYPELRQPIPMLRVAPPLRVLGMIVNPTGYGPLNVEAEKHELEVALRDLRKRGLVELHWVKGQTRKDLQDWMRKGPWHVFHFIGHGGFDTMADQGTIVLADAAGQPDPRPAIDLARLLDHSSLRLVVLNICDSAKGSEHDTFSSTANSLMERNIPAVLAMQYEISDPAATEFSRTFYKTLADGFPVDTAVSEARKGMLKSKDTFEWVTPVLHMRSSDGKLLDLSPRARLGEVSNKQAYIVGAVSLAFIIGIVVFAMLILRGVWMPQYGGEATPVSTSMLEGVRQISSPTVAITPTEMATAVADALTVRPTESATPNQPEDLTAAFTDSSAEATLLLSDTMPLSESVQEPASGLGSLYVALPEDAPALYPVTINDSVNWQQFGVPPTGRRFQFPPGTYTVTLPLPFIGVSYGNVRIGNDQAVTLSLGTDVARLEIALPEGAHLTSVVLKNARTGVTYPLAGDESLGSFWLAPGTYSVKYGWPFFGIKESSIEFRKGETVSLDVSQTVGKMELRLPPKTSLSTISVYEQNSGNYVGYGYGVGPYWLPNGVYKIDPSSPFCFVTRNDVVIASHTTATVDLTSDIGELILQPPKGISLSGASLVRHTDGGTSSESSDDAGPFWVPAGVYSVEPGSPFLGVHMPDVVVTNGRPSTVTVSADGLGQLVLQTPPDVTLSGIEVSEQYSQQYVDLGEGSGPFWLPSGTYRIQFRAPYIGIGSQNVIIESGKTKTLILPDRLGRLYLLLPNGLPPSYWFSVSNQDTNNQIGGFQAAKFFLMPQGTYNVDFQAPLMGVSKSDILIEAGKAITVDMASQLGRLVLRPPQGVTVDGISAADQESGKSLGRATGSGPFWFLPGTYVITPTAPFSDTQKEITMIAGHDTLLSLP
jgi:hypothetical protein